ncbi:MAG: MFS transporter [Candidatus Omnitrophota bacterium]
MNASLYGAPSAPTPSPSNNHNQRNFIMHFFDGALYMGGLAFTSPEIVLSVLIYRLGGSEAAIGGVFALTELGQALPQLLMSPIMDGLPRKKFTVLCGAFLQRLPWLILGLLLWLGNVDQSGKFAPIVLALVAVAFLAGGAIGPAWNAFVASTVPQRRRGRLFALRQQGAGVLGIAAGIAAAYVIDSFPFPYNFSFLFFITYFFWMSSLASLAFVKESPLPARPHESMREYYCKHIPGILRQDKDFRWFLVLKAGMLLSMISFGFYSVYAIKHFQAPPYYAGRFTSGYMLGQIFFAFLFGAIVDRYGHRINAIYFCLIIIAQNILALMAPSVAVFFGVFLIMGAIRSIQIITFITMPMEYADSRDHPTYYALSNTLLAPFYLSGLLGGFFVPYIGYRGLFLLSSFFALLTLICAIRFVRDPRHGRDAFLGEKDG